VAARGVIRAGLDQCDVAEAVASSTGRDANTEYQLARIDRLGRRLSTVWGRAASLLIGMSTLQILGYLWTDLVRNGFSFAWAIKTLLPLIAGSFTVALAVAPKRIIATLTGGTSENASFLRKLWTGPAGRWLFKLAGVGLGSVKATHAPEPARTEVLLARAVGELFQQLKPDQRARLGDVGEVVRGLERAASELRGRRDDLVKAIADVGEPEATAHRVTVVTELKAAQVTAERRLSTAVTALENLRLDLLRLRAGVGGPDDLTLAIQEARAVGETVDAELAAREEVGSLTPRTTRPMGGP